MALTKISTDGVKNDAITKSKIPADQIEASELANDAVDTNAIQDDAVTEDKLANSINSAIAANSAKTSNATHTGDVTGSTSLTIANDAVGADQLASNAVVNDSVASNAAIAGSKVAPDFGSQNVATTGTISDSKGNVRKIPRNDKTADYTAVAGDAGKAITTNISSGTITINANVFTEGDALTILNYGSSALTIAQGSGFGLTNSADGATGNRTLASKGMATIYFLGGTAGYISGAGLS